VIPASAMTWRFSRGTGPGGQGVNTTDSRVELVVDLAPLVTSPEVAARVRGKLRRFAPDRRQHRAIPTAQSRLRYAVTRKAMAMRIDRFTFGSIRIDGVIYEHDVVITRGRVQKRKKKVSKPFRDAFGHTPLSIEENIPWDCRRLVVGTGADGRLPVMDEVRHEADRREVELLTLPTSEAIRALQGEPKDTNAVLHVTC
jgi:hypothetical protein